MVTLNQKQDMPVRSVSAWKYLSAHKHHTWIVRKWPRLWELIRNRFELFHLQLVVVLVENLDLSIQPLVALAAWILERPVRCIYTRPESLASSTKRHPVRMSAKAGCTSDGKLTAFEYHGEFNTGAYASWGPTVADRVPIHCSGPYLVPNVLAETCALLTNESPSGAFRGFGVPQGAIAHEALMDELAVKDCN